MATGLDTLCDYRIRAVILEPARLCDRCRGAQDREARGLETIDQGCFRQPEVEADDFWLQLNCDVAHFRTKGFENAGGRCGRIDTELGVIAGEPLAPCAFHRLVTSWHR